MMRKDTAIGMAIMLFALFYGLSVSFGTPTASINSGELQGNCIEFGNNGCEEWLYDNTDQLDTVSADALDGLAKSYEGECLETKQGKCVLIETPSGQEKVWVGDIEDAPTAPKAKTGCILGFFCGGGSEDDSDSTDDVDVGVDDETHVEYSDGTEETFDSSDDEDGDGFVDEDEGFGSDNEDDTTDTSDSDDSDSGGSSGCSWWDITCSGDDDDEEDEEPDPYIEETRYECRGDSYSNGNINGKEKLVKVEDWVHADDEEEVVDSINNYDIAEGETPYVCVNPTGEDAKMVRYQYEVNLQTLLGKLGLL